MKKIIAAAIAAITIALAALPARAQFADQATYAGAGAGTANAQTITLSNASAYADVLGVLVKFTPTATNTGAATLKINSFASSPEIRKANGSGLVALTGGEVVSGQPTVVMYNGTYFVLMSPLAMPIGAANLQTSAFGFNVPVNFQINGTVSSNQLTIAIKTAAGTDATSASPIPIAFRDTTIANGGPVWVSLTGALSFTIGSGSTMGCNSGQMCRLWITVVNNGGTMALCAINARSGTSIAPLNETTLQNSASGTTGGSSAQTLYCSTSSIASKAMRIVGYIEIQETTAGIWATGPTYVQLFGPGIKKPGDIVQPRVYTTTTPTAVSSNTKVATSLAGSITPTSAANLIKITAAANVTALTTSGTTDFFFAQIWRNIGTGAIGNVSGCYGAGGSATCPVNNLAVDAPNATSSTQYGVYINKTTAASGTFNFLGTDNGMQTNTGVMILEEIMGALEPANDDEAIRFRNVG